MATTRKKRTKRPAARGEERVETLHPAGKNGVRITRPRYDSMRRALLKVIPRRADGVAFRDLTDLVGPHLDAEAFR
ncbi:MAG: DUF6958 family protein, partial [Planctomycetota bacterium JB042]